MYPLELVVQKYPKVSDDKIDLKDAGMIPFGSTISNESNYTCYREFLLSGYYLINCQ